MLYCKLQKEMLKRSEIFSLPKAGKTNSRAVTDQNVHCSGGEQCSDEWAWAIVFCGEKHVVRQELKHLWMCVYVLWLIWIDCSKVRGGNVQGLQAICHKNIFPIFQTAICILHSCNFSTEKQRTFLPCGLLGNSILNTFNGPEEL